MIKVKVIALDQPDDPFTIGKVYDAWGLNGFGSVDIIDDNGKESALFSGEFEVVDA
jgi:hypothetical protein